MMAPESAGQVSDATSTAERANKFAEQALDELARQLEAGNSAKLDACLSAMSRFHRYSFGNILLILSQRPEATHVAGFHTWRSLGRSVKRGEKGIAIFAPMMIRPRAEAEATEAGIEENQRPRLRFRVVHVFDIAQTEGEPLPEPARVSGDPGEQLAALEAAVQRSGIALETVDSLGGAEGMSSGGKVTLKSGLSPAHRFSVLAHEWAHELLHRVETAERPTKTVRETEAEAVAFVVCRSIGLETGRAAADYIRLYRGDKETLAASLDRIQKTACTIIEAIERPQQSEGRLSKAIFAIRTTAQDARGRCR